MFVNLVLCEMLQTYIHMACDARCGTADVGLVCSRTQKLENRSPRMRCCLLSQFDSRGWGDGVELPL